jgi:ABC-type transporter Mla subunit MlaD
MPNYNELIQQAQANVKSLSEKLKDIDHLHQDIKKLIEQPLIYDKQQQEIVKLVDSYINKLGAATKKYLDGNNILFTEKLKELSNKNGELKEEIERLEKIDLEKHFDEIRETVSKRFTAIDLTLSNIAQILNGINQSLNTIQTTIIAYHDDTKKHLGNQGMVLSSIEHRINSLEKQNSLLRKEIKKDRIMLSIGIFSIFLILSATLVFVAFKLKFI